MLINTVLVLLQSLLPIFLVVSLLLALQRQNLLTRSANTGDETIAKQTEQVSHLDDLSVISAAKLTNSITLANVINTSFFAFIIVCLLSYYMPSLSQLFTGNGLEIIFSILFGLIYGFIILAFLISQKPLINRHKDSRVTWQNSLINIAILLLVFSVHGSYFSFYLKSLTTQSMSITPFYAGIVMGIIIGTGICLSIAILLYFFLMTVDKKPTSKVASYLLLLFGVGQLMQGLQLLEQVDIIASNSHLWSTSYLISEDSELGYFLTILFGYEATPSAMELAVYISAILLPLSVGKFITYKHHHATLTNGTE
ncbi:hypothetical protein [Colwellia ponticola]|uniref:Iron permease n=1 Tax=Colwellia ponticola TaxID=2304625 RepID=A0A8H2JJZ4_9GAMM|nr:hypothetical protein [Colwellia ponticola]TMM43764.1 hypothetical protein FCS21_12615 [Colwellia ponticola]